MSNNAIISSNGMATEANKKRKRKRNNSKKGGQSETSSHDSNTNLIVVPTPVKIQKNKKIKFDDEHIEKTENIIEKRKNTEVADQEESPVQESSVHESSVHESPVQENPAQEIDIEAEEAEEDQEILPVSKKQQRKQARKVVYQDTDDEEEDGTRSNAYHKLSETTKAQLLKRSNELFEIRQQLPIYQHKTTIIDYISKNQVTVIIGETGSGKSTQIPQFLMPLNKKQIAVTQPRRVAAASLAARVSEEYGCSLGQEVGYQVRFSNITNPYKTKLKYLTDGMLLRELMMDAKLSKYSTIILDEAHERTILTDLIMGFLKQLIVSKQRTDLKVIIMSATLNAELFSKFFDNAPVLFVEGKMYPVSQFYLSDKSEDIVDTMVRTIIQVNRSELEGDILCFLPGQEEIDNAVSTLQQLAPELPKDSPLIVPLPLYAALSPAQQAKIFESLPKRRRKIILATNIAETSITVSGVKYVIDSGLRKVKVWKHQLGLSTLLTTPISQASAKQRAGRAGRESEGKVFRLYLENVFLSQLPKQQESEIMRNDIILPILTLKKAGVDDLLNWTWLEHPGQEAILSALNTLYSLGALNDSGKITSLGYKMAVLPLPPQLSVVLITAMEFKVLAPVIDIVACLSVDNLILNVGGGNGELRDEVNFKRRLFCPLGSRYGDLICLKEFFDHYQAMTANPGELKAWCKDLHFSYKGFKNVMKVRHQLKEYMIATIKQDDSLKNNEKESLLRDARAQLDVDTSDDEDNFTMSAPLDIPLILKSFLKGYITNTAVGMPDRSYRTFNSGQLISIHPSSNLFGKSNLDAIMYIEYVFTSKGYGRSCSVIELSWLQEIAPHILGASKINVHE